MSVTGMLKRRGFEILRCDPFDHLVFPKFFPKRSKEKLFALLHSYAFRTLLKDVILLKDGFRIQDLTHYCSEETSRGYVKEILGLKLVKHKKDGSYQMLRGKEVFSLGETLEWYLASLIQEELECDALWNVTLEGLPAGGDFDVLADVENHLMVIEVKSSPPKSIEIENIRAFLNRIEDLEPDLAIFFEDTTLRMKDKIVPIFEEELTSRFRCLSHLTPQFERLQDETFRYGSLFITNSKPGILENIRFCIASFLKDRGIRLSQGVI